MVSNAAGTFGGRRLRWPKPPLTLAQLPLEKRMWFEGIQTIVARPCCRFSGVDLDFKGVVPVGEDLEFALKNRKRLALK